jgi:hypothetical protein
MKQKTAVEWLVEQLTPAISLQQKYIDELKEKAKQKEKQQIINAALVMYHSGMNKHQLTPEEYYNKIYLKENK